MKHLLPILLALFIAISPAQAQKKKKAPANYAKPLSGLYLNVDAGLLIPNDKQSNFYCGRPNVPNDLRRVLNSQMYGTQIWNNLVSQQLISPSAIHDYGELRVAEYADMYYKLSFQLGFGFRYVRDNGWGWLMRFDFADVTAAGQFLIDATNGTGILGQNQYVTCGIFGREKRIFIDFGIAKRIPLTNLLDLEIDFGFDVNNIKVSQNAISVGGQTYSILDVWDGRTPEMGTGTYEYINQGALGIGGFATIALSRRLPSGALDLGYTCAYMQTKYRTYNETDCYAPQHTIFLRFNLNNFSFFKK